MNVVAVREWSIGDSGVRFRHFPPIIMQTQRNVDRVYTYPFAHSFRLTDSPT